jgi:hypothetical protein
MPMKSRGSSGNSLKTEKSTTNKFLDALDLLKLNKDDLNHLKRSTTIKNI